jgi:hypothetical protein
VVNHLHRTVSILFFFFHPWHKRIYPLAARKISVTARLPLNAAVWLQKVSRAAEKGCQTGARLKRVYFRSDLFTHG